MKGFHFYLIKSHKQIPIDLQSVVVKKLAHYASAIESSNQVASSSKQVLWIQALIQSTKNDRFKQSCNFKISYSTYWSYNNYLGALCIRPQKTQSPLKPWNPKPNICRKFHVQKSAKKQKRNQLLWRNIWGSVLAIHWAARLPKCWHNTMRHCMMICNLASNI
jgi:hypothetical protein